MGEKSEISVTIKTTNGKVSQGKVHIQIWSKQERLKKAAKVFGLLFALALVSVFLPVAHFILVPGFLIAAPIAGHHIFKQESAILGGEGVCPNCSKQLPIEKGPNRWPLDDLCTVCQTHLSIEKFLG